MVKLLLLLLVSCNAKFESDAGFSIDGPFSDNQGKCLLNIGHRVGGDIKGLSDNSIETAIAVKHLENHKCFKRWEFDAVQFGSNIYVAHSKNDINNESLELIEFIEELVAIGVKKPIAIDLKDISKELWDTIINAVITGNRYVEVKVIIYKKRVKNYKDLISHLKEMGVGVFIYE